MGRLISAFLVALAMFLSPMLMASGGAAMAHASATSVTAEHGHCEDGKAPADKDRSHAKMSCASACAAFVAPSPDVSPKAAQAKAPTVAARLSALSGTFPERETPPPRAASAI